MKVLGFGDCCVDYYIDKKTAYPGGNAFNVAYFAGQNGAEAAFIGTISTDVLGKHIMKCASDAGIDITHAPIKTGILGRAAVKLVDGERKFISKFFGDEHGVGTLYPPMLSQSDLDYISEFDLVHCSCYAHIEDQLERISSLPVLKSFDFSCEDEYRADAYLEKTCPYIDLAMFSCERLADDATNELVEKVKAFGCKNVLLTFGARGQQFICDSGTYAGSAEMVEAVDTMAAGDSFCAAFISGLLKRGWHFGVQPCGSAVAASLKEASAYSAKNCLVDGSFGHGLYIEY